MNKNLIPHDVCGGTFHCDYECYMQWCSQELVRCDEDTVFRIKPLCRLLVFSLLSVVALMLLNSKKIHKKPASKSLREKKKQFWYIFLKKHFFIVPFFKPQLIPLTIKVYIEIETHDQVKWCLLALLKPFFFKKKKV